MVHQQHLTPILMHCISSMVVNFIHLAFIKLYRWCAYHPVIHYSMPLAPVDNNRATVVGGLTEQGRHCPIQVQWEIELAFVSSRVVVGHLVGHVEQHIHRVSGALYCRNITLPSCHRTGYRRSETMLWMGLALFTPPPKKTQKQANLLTYGSLPKDAEVQMCK